MQQTVALVSLVLTAVKGEGTTTVESLGDRSFLLHLPSAYDDAAYDTFPLVLNLHGYSSNMHVQAAWSNMNNHANQNGYIAVYPQGKSLGSVDISDMDMDNCVVYNQCVMNLTYWNDLSQSGSPGPLGPTCIGEAAEPRSVFHSMLPAECQDAFGCNIADCTTDDIGFIEDLLDELEANYRVDSSRVYVTGYSNGAQMTHRLGCELSERIAAIAPVMAQPLLGFNCAPSKGDSLPILNIWGTRDTSAPGLDIINEYDGYVTPVPHVMYVMGEYNGCEVEDEVYVDVATSADGIREWQCVGYESCDFAVMSCSWNATHYEFPTTYTEDGHFALDVVWDFFQKYSKPQQKDNRKKNKQRKSALMAPAMQMPPSASDNGNVYEIVISTQALIGIAAVFVLLVGCGIYACNVRGRGQDNEDNKLF